MQRYVISVFQAGRFGNNLFQLSAAFSLQDELKSINHKRKYISIIWYGYSSDIEKICRIFSLPVVFKRKRFIEYLIAGPISLQDRNIYVRAIYSLWWKLEKFNKTEIRSTNDFLGKKKFKKSRFLLTGYFHNYSTASALINRCSNLNTLVMSCSKNLQNQIESLNAEYIGIHLRFGDYLLPENRKSLGELDGEYYYKGLKLLHPLSNSFRILIFSDDPMAAQSKLARIPNCEFKFARDFCENSFEEFVLLTFLSKKILSNSTFSWWAGYLSDGLSHVVATHFPWSNYKVSVRARYSHM